MRKLYLIFSIFTLFIFPLHNAAAQSDSGEIKGIKIIVPSKEKKNNSYFFISGGYQFASWYKVPMVPENHTGLTTKGHMDVKVPGWFCGIGIMKKTRSNFEVGILADFYRTIIPLAYSGQRSTSDWVFEQTGNVSYFTDVFENDINRISEVYSFRAAVRYKVPIGKFQIWGGLAPGTYASKIYFVEKNSNGAAKEFRETSLGLSYQAGINFVVKNARGKDMLRFTLYSDFGSPGIEEKMISLFNHPTWNYSNSEGNSVINPVRLGFAIGIH
jgi:hypothetical protein